MMLPVAFPAIIFDRGSIEFRITRIESCGSDPEFDRGRLLKIMQQMQQYDTVFAAGNSDKDPVSVADKPKASYGFARKFSDTVNVFTFQLQQFQLNSFFVAAISKVIQKMAKETIAKSGKG